MFSNDILTILSSNKATLIGLKKICCSALNALALWTENKSNCTGDGGYETQLPLYLHVFYTKQAPTYEFRKIVSDP